jgi:hypothetical protein
LKAAAKSATLLVLTHLAVLVGHGAAHTHLQIGTNRWQSAFIAVVIFVCPVLATGLIWAGWRAGLILLGLSFAGSFVFGVCYHFMLSGHDNVFSAGHTGWAFCFRMTALALALLELLGCVWSGRIVLGLSQRYRTRHDGFAGS